MAISQITRPVTAKKFSPDVIIAAVAVLAYSGSISYGFVYDDVTGILNNPRLAGVTHLGQALVLLSEPWRAVTQSSFALTTVLTGLDPRFFHATNVLLHAINSLLVYGIARLAARQWVPEDRMGLYALAAGLLHAVHPVYSEGVAYVWGRSSSLCAMFYFGSLLSVMTGHRASARQKYLWIGLAALLGVLAWKSKEEAITLPLLIAAYLALAGSWRSAAAVVLMPVGVVLSRWTAIAEVYERVRQNQALVLAGASPSLDPLVYFLTHVKASVFYYLRMFLLPVHQSVDPQIDAVNGLANPGLWMAVLVLAALVAWAAVAFRKHPVVSFAVMAWLLSPLTAYAVMPLADVVAEHRAYISGLGFDLLGAWLLVRYVPRPRAVLAAAVLLLALLTIHRNPVWESDLTLWKDAVEKSPGLARPHLNLGLAYQSTGQPEAAMAEYRLALTINPRLTPAYINIGGVYFSNNDLESAESALLKAAELSPLMAEPYIDLAAIALRRNQPAEALRLLDKAADLDDSYLVHLNKSDVLRQLGRRAEADREYQRAVELRPALSQHR